MQFRAPAQPPVSTRDAVYSDGQATRGEAMYKKACASCHREMLEGNGSAPPLTGDDFATDWKGQTLAQLFNKIRDTMPADSPGSLSSEEDADLIAYILKFNKLPAGNPVAFHPTSTTRTSITFVPVGPVLISPSTFSKK